MRCYLCVMLLAFCAACSVGPTNTDAPALYDLGAPRSYVSGQTRIAASLLVHNFVAPAWLDTQGIVYRLGYQDPARQQIYAGSRWVAPPAVLLTQRLRGRLAAASDGGVIGVADSARADYALRVELEDFSQLFDTAAGSRAVLVARVSMVSVARRALLAQESFFIERPAATPNAQGGAHALAAAADELIEAITTWSAAQAAKARK